MLLISEEELSQFEVAYPGVRATILYFDNLDVPNCPICNSSDAARVSVGVVGRSMRVDLARSEFKLLDNRSCRGRHYCNACERFFD